MKFSITGLTILLWLFTTGSDISAQQVAAPELRCLSVNCANGNVTLTWTIPPDPGSTFVAYHVFKGGSYLASVGNRLTNTYTDISGSAMFQSECYYVETESFIGNPVTSPALDTLCTMFLTISNPGGQVATLNWNAPRNPLLSTMQPWYKIYCDYPVNGTFVDSTQALTYVDTQIVCNRTISYSIELADNMPCFNISMCAASLFKDATPPATPVIDSVSVNALNNATIGWTPPTSGDVTAYVIYQFVNNLWVAIDTVYGYGNTSYGNPNSAADVQSEWYCIAAMDSCGNLSPLGNYHNTMYLTGSVDPCSASTNLSWNPYINWPGGVSGYEIWVSVDGGPYSLAGTTTSGVTNFSHTSLNNGSVYCYNIHAIENASTRTSTSNTLCLNAALPTAPVFTYGQSSSVIAPENVRIDAYVDILADVTSYVFERADALTGPYMVVGTVPFTGTPNIFLLDGSAYTETQSHYYRIISIDSCGNPVQTSNISRTIFATATANNNMTNTLTWNDYEGFDAGVLSYDIYRSVDFAPFTLISTVGPGNTVFVDDAVPFIQGSGRFEYYIVANEDAGNQYNITGLAASNIAEAFQTAKFYVPNAFVPGGVNSVFLPNGSFYDKSEFTMTIHNRWGQLLFTSDNPFIGWDGTFEGSVCQEDAYVWFIKYKTAAGEYIEQYGTVSLIGK
ncbi:MAG: gliding motility-associated C-terminal domain-containing protein [Bacteroidia bacterium]|nr:gliding motility-associated C-terminal domain-containing protein [Bacteroidia bacterium]